MAPPTGAQVGATSILTAMIVDNDGPLTARFTAASQTVIEGAGLSVSITVALNRPAAGVVTVPYLVTGSATQPADHNLANSSVIFAAGEETKTFSFLIVNDSLQEATESIIITMDSLVGAVAGDVNQHTVLITDDDAIPDLYFASASTVVSESAGLVNIAVSVSNPSSSSVTVPYSVSGTSSTPSDHNLVDSSITIAAGQTSGVIAITVVDDSMDEPSETVIVTIGAPTGANLLNPSVHQVTITDNDSAPAVSFATASSAASESAGAQSIAVSISEPSSFIVSIPVSVSGSATQGSDYSLATSIVTIPAGSSGATFEVTLLNDSAYEGSETLVIQLGTPTNATLGAIASHTLTIGDDESIPEVSFSSASSTAAESAGTVTVTAQLNHGRAAPASVPYTVTGTATRPGDHSLSNGTLSFAAGSTSTSVSFEIINDGLYDPGETIILSLGAPTGVALGSQTTHVLTVTDDEAVPVVSFASAAQSVGEAAGTINATLTITPPSGAVVSVPYSISGTSLAPGDHNATSGTMEIPAGSASYNYPITVVDDLVDEASETVTVTLQDPVGAPTLGTETVHTVTIVDNDDAPKVSFLSPSSSASEGVGIVEVSLQLDRSSSSTITVPYTVGGTSVRPNDHSLANGSLEIAPGVTTAKIEVPVVDDDLFEGSESVIITLGAATNADLGATTQHTLTITDNEAAPQVRFSSASSTQGEAVSAASIMVTTTRAASVDFTFNYTVDGTASNPSDHNLANGVLTIPAGSSSGTIDFSVVDDSLFEVAETVILTLSGPNIGSVGDLRPLTR